LRPPTGKYFLCTLTSGLRSLPGVKPRSFGVALIGTDKSVPFQSSAPNVNNVLKLHI
jgi:hypothetical protein